MNSLLHVFKKKFQKFYCELNITEKQLFPLKKLKVTWTNLVPSVKRDQNEA